MDKFLIKGGKALRGTVAVSGAKNSALPLMAAALLTSDKVVVRNVPKVRDLITMSKLLAFMDAKVSASAVPASEGRAHCVRENHRDGDRRHFDGSGAGGRRDRAGKCGARAGSDGLGRDAAEDGGRDLWRGDFDAADSRREGTARYGAYGDSG